MFYGEKNSGFSTLLLYLGSYFQSYNDSRMEFVKMNSTSLETSKKFLSATISHRNAFSICPSRRVLRMMKKILHFLLIVELYGKYFVQPCLAAVVQRNYGKPFDNIPHRNGSGQ